MKWPLFCFWISWEVRTPCRSSRRYMFSLVVDEVVLKPRKRSVHHLVDVRFGRLGRQCCGLPSFPPAVIPKQFTLPYLLYYVTNLMNFQVVLAGCDFHLRKWSIVAAPPSPLWKAARPPFPFREGARGLGQQILPAGFCIQYGCKTNPRSIPSQPVLFSPLSNSVSSSAVIIAREGIGEGKWGEASYGPSPPPPPSPPPSPSPPDG